MLPPAPLPPELPRSLRSSLPLPLLPPRLPLLPTAVETALRCLTTTQPRPAPLERITYWGEDPGRAREMDERERDEVRYERDLVDWDADMGGWRDCNKARREG